MSALSAYLLTTKTIQMLVLSYLWCLGFSRAVYVVSVSCSWELLVVTGIPLSSPGLISPSYLSSVSRRIRRRGKLALAVNWTKTEHALVKADKGSVVSTPQLLKFQKRLPPSYSPGSSLWSVSPVTQDLSTCPCQSHLLYNPVSPSLPPIAGPLWGM